MSASELKIARLRKGIPQKELAQAAGIHYSQLSGIECRRIVANAEQRQAIISTLGGSESDYFEQSGLAK